MYGIDWSIPEPKKRGRKPGQKDTKPRKKYKTRDKPGKPKKLRSCRIENPVIGQANGKRGGRSKGSVTSAETRLKQGRAVSESKWRQHSPNKGSASMQSSAGSADSDYSVCDFGRVFPKRALLDEDWDNG